MACPEMVPYNRNYGRVPDTVCTVEEVEGEEEEGEEEEGEEEEGEEEEEEDSEEENSTSEGGAEVMAADDKEHIFLKISISIFKRKFTQLPWIRKILSPHF